MISITRAAAICNLGENIDEIFYNACNGKLLPHHVTIDLPEIKEKKYNNFVKSKLRTRFF